MAQAYLEVVEVVGRGDLDHTGAELQLNVFVGYHRDLATDQRQDDVFPDQVFVAFVLGVHRHGGIAQHGLGTGGGDDHKFPRFTGHRVTDVPEVSLVDRKSTRL